jgi:hypothetical protein
MTFGPHTITRLRPSTKQDRFSGEATAWDWSTPSALTVTGCSVQPGSAQLIDRQQRQGVVVDFTIWAPLDADIVETDRIVYATQTFLVVDTIQRWDFPGGHLVIPIRRMEG